MKNAESGTEARDEFERQRYQALEQGIRERERYVVLQSTLTVNRVPNHTIVAIHREAARARMRTSKFLTKLIGDYMRKVYEAGDFDA